MKTNLRFLDIGIERGRHTCVLRFLVLCFRFSRRGFGVGFCNFDIRFEALRLVSDCIFNGTNDTYGSASAQRLVEQPSRKTFDDVVDWKMLVVRGSFQSKMTVQAQRHSRIHDS